MIGGHLRGARGRGAACFAPEAFIAGDGIARFDKIIVIGMAVLHIAFGQTAEFINIELVIGKNHKILEIFRSGRGVMVEPVQGIINARRGEGGQRIGASLRGDQGAVGNFIVGVGQIGSVKQIAQGYVDFADIFVVDSFEIGRASCRERV